MKNDLTAEEWSVLGDYIHYNNYVYVVWRDADVLKRNIEILDRARKKFDAVIEEIKDNE